MIRRRTNQRLCPRGYAFDSRRAECRYVGDVRALGWTAQIAYPPGGVGHPDPLAWIARMQHEQILGLGGETYTYGQIRHALPYSGLGADLAPYDLNAPGAVAEVKRSLRSLAEAESDPFKKCPIEVVTETTWKDLTDDDVWDEAAAEEMLLAASRYRGMGWQVPPPYVQQGEPGGGPQPSVNGLELIAGAANQRLGGSTKMKLYEAWRKAGCTFQATCFDPPSAVSRPASETAVTRTLVTGPRKVAPPTATDDYQAAIKAADDYQQALWMQAAEAPNETERLRLALFMKQAAQARDAVVDAAAAAAPVRTGTTTVDDANRKCQDAGGKYDVATGICTGAKKKEPSQAGLYIGVGLAAVALFWALGSASKKGGR